MSPVRRRSSDRAPKAAHRVRHVRRVAWLLLAGFLALGVTGADRALAVPLPDCCAQQQSDAHDPAPCGPERPCLSPLDACGCEDAPAAPGRAERSSLSGPAAASATHAASAPLPDAPRMLAAPAAAEAARRALLETVVLRL